MSVHSTSLSSFDKNHQLYDQVRPDFLPEAVEQMVTDLELPDQAEVVELAAGTGKFTKSIAKKGWKVTAVEPSQGMIDSFVQNFPSIPCLKGSSYALPFDTHSVDCIFIAQAFHWFADAQSVAEFARVLKPRVGKLVMIWNYEQVDGSEPAWQRATQNYIWQFNVNVPQYQKMQWPSAFTEGCGFVLPYHERHFRWTQKYEKGQIWPYWQSRSYITHLGSEKQAEVRDTMKSLLEDNLTPEDLDADGKITAQRGEHVVIYTRK